VLPPIEEREKERGRRRSWSNIRYQDRRLPDGRLERIASAKPGFKLTAFIYRFHPDDPEHRTMELVTQRVSGRGRKQKDVNDG
jgi:hypothetical protein